MVSQSHRTLMFVAVVWMSCEGAHAGEELIPRGAGRWKYQDGREAPAEGWTSADFDDTQWRDGPAILGYGDPDIQTRLSFGSNPQNKHPAAFFRRRFLLRDRGRFKKFVGRIACDDGAVVYLNRREVFRHNMPAGPIQATTLALGAVGPDLPAERQMVSFLVEPEGVQNGDNLIAVSVHQANPTSSDLALDLQFTGLETEEEVQQAEASLPKKSPVQKVPAVETSQHEATVLHFNVRAQ